MTVVLDLGCGSRKRPGAIGTDLNQRSAADIIHDLSRFPYPFRDSSANEVHLDNVLEHLDDIIPVMEELHRICAPGALVTIHVPYFRSRWAAIDPTHRHQFTTLSFAYFDPTHSFHDEYRYSEAQFRTERVTFNLRWPRTGIRGVIARFANRSPERYEARWSHLVPLDELTFELRVIKA